MSSIQNKKTLAQIKAAGYGLHHYASRRGYCRVADIGDAEPYKGKYGTGYIVRCGRYYYPGSCKGSTNYEQIAYYTITKNQ